MIKASQVFALTANSPSSLEAMINERIGMENLDDKVLATIASTSYTTFMWEGKIKFSALVVFHYQDAE